MKQSLRPFVAAALVATMSLGVASQAKATTEERSEARVSAAATSQSSSARNAETAAGYLKQWMFDANNPHHPLRAKSDFNGPASRNTNLKNWMPRRFLQGEHQTFGINLDWSHTPRFEWKLLGGKIGEQVRSGDWLAIYNTKTQQPLIYFDRTVGGDIGWPDSETWSQQIGNVVMRFIKDHWKEGAAYLLTL